jgi:hypothetical protein
MWPRVLKSLGTRDLLALPQQYTVSELNVTEAEHINKYGIVLLAYN